MANFALIAPAQQWVDANGDPRSGYRLFTYDNRTSTKKTTYTTAAGGIANSNPIVLDSGGRTPNQVFGSTGAYTLLLAPPGSDDPPLSTTWSQDDIEGINDIGTASIDQWVTSGFTPVYDAGSAGTRFTVPGDQTSILQVGRRLKTINSGGAIYSTITAAVYGTDTLVTVVSDSGALDAGLSTVSYGLLSATNPSAPTITALPTATIDVDADFIGFLDTSVLIMGKALPKNITPASACLVIAYLPSAFNTADATATEVGSAGGAPVFTVVSNVGSNFNATTGRFTAPATGVYQFNWSACLNALAALATTRFNTYIANTAFSTLYAGGSSANSNGAGANSSINSSGGSLIKLTAGDVVSMWILHTTGATRFVNGTASGQDQTKISIMRIT